MDTHNPPDPSCVHPFGGPLHSPASTAAEDQAFALALGRLAALPPKQRMAFVGFVNFWLGLPWPTRAKLAKAAKPDATDAEIAGLAGRSRRHLLRDDGYQLLKPKLADFKASRPRADGSVTRRRRGFSNPGHPA